MHVCTLHGNLTDAMLAASVLTLWQGYGPPDKDDHDALFTATEDESKLPDDIAQL